MEFSFLLKNTLGAVLALVCISSATAKSDLPQLAPEPAIAVAAPQTPTFESASRAPTGLKRDDAFILATAVAAQSGRDIIISRVQATGSMRPYFDENSLLLLEASPFSELKIGDVVTYYHPAIDQIVAHRLVEKRGDKFWSRGDHNTGMDNVYVTKENYRRKLIGVLYMEPVKAPAPAPAESIIAQAGSPAAKAPPPVKPAVPVKAVKVIATPDAVTAIPEPVTTAK